MRNKILLLAIIMTIFICGCKATNNPGNINENKELVGKAPQASNVDILKDRIEKMTLDEKIGQIVMVGLDGYENDQLSREMIQRYKVCGFTLFKRNIRDADQTLKLINSLKNTNKENKIPLFFAVDEEGGRVTRVPREFVKIPSNKNIGRINSEDLSFEIGNILGEQLKALGLNMNFAPVLDIDSNPENPVIGDRSFGADDEIVSKLGIQTMRGIQSQVISVVKHFPGHGDTSVDSHIGLPVINHDLKRLREFELIPFKNAIENGADVVMVAHILLPEIDEHNPATLSKRVVTGILREEMEFDGVIITDDMTMGAIVENYDIGDAAVKSVMAGADIILVCHDHEKQLRVAEALKSAAEKGTISVDVLDEHLYRILKLKQKYRLDNEEVESPDVEGINSKIRDILNAYLSS